MSNLILVIRHLANSPESPRLPRSGGAGMDRRAVTMPSTTNAAGEEVEGKGNRQPDFG